MHTIFINTSEHISFGLYQDVLFEKLIKNKDLIIPADNIQIGSMKEYAESIARTIDQEADITEDTSLIVFIENRRTSDDPREESQDVIRPEIFADETLYSIKAEAFLAGTLGAHGKRPKKLIFVFGERIKRNHIIPHDKPFREDMYKRMWKMIQLSPCRNVIESIHELEKEGLSPDKEGYEKSIELIRNCLIKDADKGNQIISEEDEECYSCILSNTAENILYNLENSNEELDERGLLFCLNNAIDLYVNNVLRNEIAGQYAESTHYMYLPMEYKDSHEIHRSALRLLLYVYAISYNANHKDYFDVELDNAQIDLQKKEYGALHACPIPLFDLRKLEETLCLHADRCRNSVYISPTPPKDFNAKVESEEKLILSGHEVPELIPPNLIDKKGNVALSLLSGFIPDKLKRVGFNTSSLRKAVDRTYSDILEKSATNQKEIIKYLNRATAEYDRIKDDSLKKIPFTDDSAFIFDDENYDARKKIDDLKNMENDLQQKLIQRERQLLQTKRQLITQKDISQLVEETRYQTDYYFQSLKRSVLLLITCICFVLAVLVPYAAISKQLFAVPEGYLFFVLTGVIAIVSLVFGYELFSRIYKNKVLELVRKVRHEFIFTQKNNQECLNQYTEQLYKLIPGYYAEKHYERFLHDYKSKLEQRMEQITYHDKSRSQRIRLIMNLLDDLDCQDRFQFSEDKTRLTINPEIDRVENENVYILSAEEIKRVLIRGKGQNDE